eukprot:5727904-Alexandrium_andersonii.AAC.1
MCIRDSTLPLVACKTVRVRPRGRPGLQVPQPQLRPRAAQNREDGQRAVGGCVEGRGAGLLQANRQRQP